jgi:hypothetical protein
LAAGGARARTVAILSKVQAKKSFNEDQGCSEMDDKKGDRSGAMGDVQAASITAQLHAYALLSATAKLPRTNQPLYRQVSRPRYGG